MATAQRQRGATRAQLAYRSAHVLKALERAEAAKRPAKLWRCTAKHEHEHDAEVCRRVHSSAKQWWEREPGYLAEELEAERSKPASKPVVEPEGTRYGMNAKSWADTWRQTWQWAQQANARVTYATRADFLEAVAAHHKLLWEVGYGAA